MVRLHAHFAALLMLAIVGCADMGETFSSVPSIEQKKKNTFDDDAPPFTQPDDGEIQAAVGRVYDIGFASTWPDADKRLENFDLPSLTPMSTIVMRNFDIPEVAWEHGFPEADELKEWFAVVFEGTVQVPFNQGARFATVSDDGIRLFIKINGVWELVVSSSGLQRSVSSCGGTNLCPIVVPGNRVIPQGSYPFRLEYFQGPRMHIALQMLWRDDAVPVAAPYTTPGQHLQGHVPVPKEYILRPQ